jgi:hypothetical protein
MKLSRRAFLAGALRAMAAVAFLGAARVSVADGEGWEREPLWQGLRDMHSDWVDVFVTEAIDLSKYEYRWSKAV